MNYPRKLHLIVGLGALIIPGIARTFCSEPSAPKAPWGSAPTAPYCGSYGNLSDCSEWEVRSFRDEVEQWLNQMKRYADDIQDFANDAIEYANCESQKSIDEWNTFVGH